MFRKLALAAAALLTLGAGIASAPAPAAAQVGIYVGGPGYYYGGPGYYYGRPHYYGGPRYYRPYHRHGYYRHHRRCERVTVRRWDGYGWRRVTERRCWR